LKESFTKLGTLLREDSLEEVFVLQEGNVCILIVDEAEKRILQLTLLDVNVRILEHIVKSVLVGLV